MSIASILGRKLSSVKNAVMGFTAVVSRMSCAMKKQREGSTRNPSETHAFHIITSGLPQYRNPLAKCMCPLAWSTNQNEQCKKMSALNLSIILLGVKTAIPGGLTRLKVEENGNIMN